MHLSVVKLGTTVSLNESNLTVMHGMENMKFLSHAKRIKSFTDFNIFILFILLCIFQCQNNHNRTQLECN